MDITCYNRIAETLSAAHACLEEIAAIYTGRARIEAMTHALHLREACGAILGPHTTRALQDIQLAARIADAACCIDGLKLNTRPDMRAQATAHAEHLHTIATLIAGERVAEIYGPENDEPRHEELAA